MNNEHSEEISFFRSTLQDYIAPLMDSLREEYLRLEALPPQCQEAFLIKIYGKDFYNSSRRWISPKMLGWGILETLSKIGEYKTTGKIPEKGLASVILDEEQVAEREQELKKYTSIFSAFVEYSGKVFIFDSTFHYAERKKFYDLATLEAKDIGILSPKEIIAFLSDLASTDKKLCNTFLRSWSKHFEITFFSEAFKAKDMQSATEFLTGTHGGASPFAIEVTSVAKGLYMLRTFTQTIKQCLKASKKIDSKYYIKFSDAANQKDLAFLKDLENTYYSNSTLVELNNSLNAKEHLFTKNEYNAIIGSETDTVNNQAEELPTPDNNSAFVFEPESTARSEDGKLTPANRVNRPPRFSGDRGERAFQKLYNELNNVFIEKTSYENFAGLFRCLPPEQEPTSYYKIRWIAPKGVRSLQYFIEALYRPTNNSHATLDKQALSRIFVIDSNKELKLSNNPLYCWGKQKPIDFNNPQEKEIMAFISIINKVLE